MPSILSVHPLLGYKVEINFSNGNTVILNLTSKLRTIRFSPLSSKQVFDDVLTNGQSIYWGQSLELSTTEIFRLMQI